MNSTFLQSCKPNIESDVKATEEIHLDVNNDFDVENKRDKKAAAAPADRLLPLPDQVSFRIEKTFLNFKSQALGWAVRSNAIEHRTS